MDTSTLDQIRSFKTDYRPFENMHLKKTSPEGMARLCSDLTWHSSKPLDNVEIGDILRVAVEDTPATPIQDVRYYRVTHEPETLPQYEAVKEWELQPFRTREFAAQHKFYPYLLRGLEEITRQEAIVSNFVMPPKEVAEELIGLARLLCEESNCQKMRFGSVTLGNKGRIVSTGYNHTFPSFDEEACNPCLRAGVKSGTRHEVCRAVHSEQYNLIAALNFGKEIVNGILAVAGEKGDGSLFVNDIFYCTSCSRLMDATDLAGVITYTSGGATFRFKEDIVKESYAYLNL